MKGEMLGPLEFPPGQADKAQSPRGTQVCGASRLQGSKGCENFLQPPTHPRGLWLACFLWV